MKDIYLGIIVILRIISFSQGQQRWVWGSKRSGRQLDLHRPTLLRPTAADFPPAAAAAAAAATPPAAAAVAPGASPLLAASAGAAAPFGFIPSASSLNPHGRPDGLQSSSSSVPATQTQVSSGSFQLLPAQGLPSEPLVFRPLPLDISKLPLESSSEGDLFEGELHPPLSSPPLPLPLSREAIPQDLTRSLPLGLPGHPDPINGIVSNVRFPRRLSSDDLELQTPTRNTQTFITSPDISTLPLQGSTSSSSLFPFPSSPSGFETTFLEGQNPPFLTDDFANLERIRVHAPTPSSDKEVSFQLGGFSPSKAIKTRSEQLLKSSIPHRSSVTPKPTRIFLQHPSLDQATFLKNEVKESGHTFRPSPEDTFLPTPRGAIRFPKDSRKVAVANIGVDLLHPSDLLEPLTAGSVSEVSTYAFPPPLSSSSSSSSSLSSSPFLRRTRDGKETPGAGVHFSDADIAGVKEDKLLTLIFKKQILNKKDGISVPSYVWLWPGETLKSRRSSSGSFTNPAKHAL